MERDEVADLVQDSVSSAVSQSKNDILTGVQQLITSEMKKLSDNQKALSEMQINKISDLSSSSEYKFKRRSNEEQFKVNKKVMRKLDDCERNFEQDEMDKAKESLAEGIYSCT